MRRHGGGSLVATPSAPDSIGAGKAVYVNVVDERPNQTLGTRGVKGVGSELTVADLVDSLRNSVSQGLKNRGYSPVSAPAADGRELKVEIRDLEYNVMMGLWAGKLRAQCALQGICMIGQTRPVEKLFRGEHTESVQVVQGADANTHYVNDAISKAVNALVYDAELGKCLSSGGP